MERLPSGLPHTGTLSGTRTPPRPAPQPSPPPSQNRHQPIQRKVLETSGVHSHSPSVQCSRRAMRSSVRSGQPGSEKAEVRSRSAGATTTDGVRARTAAITFTYCTLKSSAPASTEELMRHRGCPPASERAESHRHVHRLATSTRACDAPLKQEVTVLISLL